MANLSKNFIRQQISYQISNKNVTNLLRQTFGHKLLEKEIEVEFWTMDKGYITSFFETSLSEFLKKYVENYLPTNFMDEEENLNHNLLDISFFNHYKVIVATDIGIPAIFYNIMPQISYLHFNPNIRLFKTIISSKLEFEFKLYRYNTYKIQFHNPFADVIHSVQKGIIIDIAFPFEITVSFNLETYNVKIILPRLPETRFSIAGIKVESLEQVKIENDDTNVLKLYCSDCKEVINITNESINNTIYEYIMHSMDTGLDYKYTIVGCENSALSGIKTEELFRAFNAVKNHAYVHFLNCLMLNGYKLFLC
jgi:hypothetical protein